ncbi:DUF1826 domain-containing protein [Vibrio aquaticus]|uniref:DUF1826 domain-containing protein n=1 Tax=Vibrio aquaticus TaxID=2496559 RepID=A0A432D1U3_9VIBR|nr:DUF1826 domain-containing protein [Vibrio aquaticus]RTZ17825.1 DUF1826 domain-containing protein [Vibrio aquaticus]
MTALAESLAITDQDCFSISDDPTVLTDIYRDEINIAVWQRQFDAATQDEITQFLNEHPSLSKSLNLSPENAYESLDFALDGKAPKALVENMAELVDMFCCLFELDHVGLRLATLSGAMCPRFHVDHVPCRLVTTYQGIATQWLANDTIDRSKLGRGSNGLPDEQSGLFQNASDIEQLTSGDVALLKGTRWEGNEETGLVHRSPNPTNNEPRLLLTLDFG